ncbi:flagellar protein FlaG [Pusillimonas caeni]|nr:flagellar protein FlaG [Pusillimonas caeni]
MNPVALEVERPVLPEPARQVTPSAEVVEAGDSNQRRAAGGAGSGNALEQALEDVNSSLRAWSTGMRFDVDPEAQRVVVSLIDNETGEVLRTVPSDAVIRIAKMIVQLQGQVVSTHA